MRIALPRAFRWAWRFSSSPPARRFAAPTLRRLRPHPARHLSSSAQSPRALVTRYCVTCHNERVKTAGLMLDKMDLDRVPEGAETWEKVVRKLRGGMMPPLGTPRPDQAGSSPSSRFSKPRSTARRSRNRTRPVAASPPEPHGVRQRRPRSARAGYRRDRFSAGRRRGERVRQYRGRPEGLALAARTVPDGIAKNRQPRDRRPTIAPASAVYRVPPDRAQDRPHRRAAARHTRRHRHPPQLPARCRLRLPRQPAAEHRRLCDRARVAPRARDHIDGERVFPAPVGARTTTSCRTATWRWRKTRSIERLRTRIPVKAGPRVVGVTFIRKNAAESVEPLQPFTRDLDMQNMNGIPLIEHVQIAGPFKATGPGDTPSRRKIFVCRPPAASRTPSKAEETACATRILTTLARRAYRRPVDTDLDTLVGFYDAGRKKGTFDAGIENALRFILASPSFLFRRAGPSAGPARRGTGSSGSSG